MEWLPHALPDHLDISSAVDARAQIVVVLQYLRQLKQKTQLDTVRIWKSPIRTSSSPSIRMNRPPEGVPSSK